MSHDQSTNARISQRFAIRNLDDIYATISRENGSELTVIPADPIDISEGGVKLRVGTPFGFEELITFVLGCVEGPMRLRLSCRVAWIKEWEGCWLLGCQFIPKLPAEALEELFSSGVVERRQFPRRAVEGKATGKWELQGESFGVQLFDISEAGFCFRCASPGQIGKRIRLVVEAQGGPVIVQGKAQWCAGPAGDFLVGCTFLDHASYVSLSKALNAATLA